MLKRLHISNFALIGEMNVDFTDGLTVITGETGAGKSIFLEAMSLALGSRADLTALRDKNKKCVVEAEFELDGDSLLPIFAANDIAFESPILLRREISPEGRSRSLLNDSLVNLNVLKQIAGKVIDIHSQHETLLLNESGFQLSLLDAFAGSEQNFQEYLRAFKALNELKSKLNALEEQDKAAKKDFDYFSFLLQEFDAFDLKPGKLERLESESLSLENAESIKQHLLSSAFIINGGESNVLGELNKARQSLQQLVKYSAEYGALHDRLNAVYLELKDLGIELENAETAVEVDKSALVDLNAEIDRINRLLNKHQVKTEQELLKIKGELEEKIAKTQTLSDDIKRLNKDIEVKEKECLEFAKALHEKRKSSVGIIEKKTTEMLSSLSMPNASFKIELTKYDVLGFTGLDGIKFMFSANKGAALSELSKVASGGELSRLMLTLKSLLATKKKLPCIIFDEIDSGVSGDVANKIGNILYKMGNNMQVIAITHLPQLASKGDSHLYVYKKDDEEKTQSLIKNISGEARVQEIAKMLSAGKPTKTALINAKELLEAQN